MERFLRRRLGAAPDHVHKLLRQGRVLAAGRPLRRGHRVRAGEPVELSPPRGKRPPPLPNRKLTLRLLHEDVDLVAVDKPAPLAVHPGPGHGSDTLLNGLVARYPELLELGAARSYGLAHRLDAGTSGVLVIGRSLRGYEGLVAAFRAREVDKEYCALVRGAPPRPRGEVTAPVGGKEALTRYELVARAGPVSWLRLKPISGRTHQLRIHLASLGCPVLADPRHGEGLCELTARLYLKRLALHARRLSLLHPVRGDRLALASGVPARLRKAWRRAWRLAGEPA
ncbi:MAG: RluA family pseudouridine synthase, partial [Planctomycetota bacterium]